MITPRLVTCAPVLSAHPFPRVLRAVSHLSTSASSPGSKKPPSATLSFDDSKSSYGSKSALDLIRSYGVFRACTVGPLVRNAEFVYRKSTALLGESLTNAVVKRTFFKHFCGGEDTEDLRPTIKMLNRSGVNGILDYAAENAPDEAPDEKAPAAAAAKKGTGPNQPARVYDYAGEQACDHHVEIFKRCIVAVKDVTPNGFAALKLTALGNPLLLERMSTAIVESTKLFEKFDTDRDGSVSIEEFKAGYAAAFTDAADKVPALISQLDPFHTGKIDYIEWSKLLSPADLPQIVASCKNKDGPLSRASPTKEEVELMLRANERLREIAQCAAANKVRLLVDAEQTYYQPAIDNFVISLMKEFNDKKVTDYPVVFNTYQGYLKDAEKRVRIDVKRADRHGYHFAAKVVRGAYMYAERSRAVEKGYESPVFDEIGGTHASYDGIIQFLLRDRMERGTKAEVMLGTHNRESIEKAIGIMRGEGKGAELGVHFAQLLGMRDDLTYTLGNAGYNAYKYVPYGKVSEVMPYLIRRAQENSDITKGMGQELKLIEMEFKRRIGIMLGGK